MGRALHPPAHAGRGGGGRGGAGARGGGLHRHLLVSASGRNRVAIARARRRRARRRAALGAGGGDRSYAATGAAGLRRGAGLFRARAHRPALPGGAEARRSAGAGARGGFALAGGLGDGGGDRRARERRHALPLGLFSREDVSLLPHWLAQRGEPGARACRVPQLRGRVLAPGSRRPSGAHRADGGGAGFPRARPARRRRLETRADHPDGVRSLRPRPRPGALRGTRSSRSPRRAGGGAVRPLGIQLDGRRSPLWTRRRTTTCMISIVIPVYNEAGLVREAAAQLCRQLDELGWDYEILFAENGSREDTVEILTPLAAEKPVLTFPHQPAPNYRNGPTPGPRPAPRRRGAGDASHSL